MDQDFERFFYAALHDLRGPLRAIDNLSLWIAQDLDAVASGESKENLRLLRLRAQRMAALLTGLEAYGAALKPGAAPESVSLSAAADGLRPDLPLREGLELSIPEDLPTLRAPRAELGQVLRALLDNALRHHDKPEGRVSLEAQALDGAVRFSVKDDGPGIPLDQQARIFEPFFSLKPKDAGGGPGLGLSLVERLLKKNGATLRLESSPGHGSAFVVTWPHAA